MMQTIFLAAIFVVSQAQPSTPSGPVAVVEAATLALIDEANVPAAKEGILTEIHVKEGDTVQKGASIAQTDVREAEVKLRLAQHELAAAQEEAKSDVRVRAAQAAHRVAEAELTQAKATRLRAENSVSETEVRRLELSAERYKLEIEVARKDLAIAEITQQSKEAQVEQVQLELDKLQTLSPLDGVVVQVYKNLGEWASPGDPVARVVRMDKLRVEGDVSSDLYTPDQLYGRPVTVEVRLPGNRIVRLQGEVTYVSPIADIAGEFQVWAEVDNREEKGFWLLNPGRRVEMKIHLQ
jgi:multidrug efflux pump subunit AcrA (membrane-fusion protein)